MGCSFVQMASEDVKQLAEDCIRRIEARNTRVLNALVAEEREKLEKSWWRKLWRQEVPSDDVLREQLLAEPRGFFCLQTELSMYGWRSRQIAENLMKAASRAATVNVSAEDLDYIS